MNNQNAVIPPRVLITGGVLLAVVVASLYGLATKSLTAFMLLAAFPVGVFLLNNPRLTFMASIALTASALTLPGLPSKVNLCMLAMGTVSVTLVASAVVNRQPILGRPQTLWVAALMALMLVTAYMRGFGLRSLGGEAWGGFTYVTMLLNCLFFLAAGNAHLSERDWTRALVWMCLLSIVPTLAQAAYAYTGGALRYVFYVVVPEYQVLEFMHLRERGSELARLQQANIPSQYYFVLAFLTMAWRRLRPWTVALIVVSFILAGVSGNRIALVFNIMMAFIYTAIERDKPLVHLLFRPLTFVIVLALLVLSFAAEFLPMTFQRVLSVIPFANVSAEAREAATTTINWRIEVWAAALRQAPQYLLIGKGFAFSAQDVMTISARTLYMNDITYVLATRNYHNGMIHTLLDLGLPGLLIAVGFITGALGRHLRLARGEWHSPTMRHYHRVFLAVLLTTVVVYFVLAGGVTHLAYMFFWVLLLEGFVRTDRRAAQPDTPPPRLLGRMRRFRQA